ncbi:hypothetical protein ACROSR_14545 [Roseovarius tibetensis]|uniref:hypothetical protein n=1 Tax=Roseovarius tibetensis TaxID=2685897 RepID=UPI003D7F7D4C
MHFPNDDIHRRAGRDFDRQGPPGYESGPPSSTGLLPLLIVVVLLGGIVALGMLGSASEDEGGNGSATEQSAPESITNGTSGAAAPQQ